jgi:hypothetical protein
MDIQEYKRARSLKQRALDTSAISSDNSLTEEEEELAPDNGHQQVEEDNAEISK